MTETVPVETTEVAEAVDFDGEDDYLSRSSDLIGNQDSKTFTFSTWVYPDSNKTGSQAIYNSYDTPNIGMHIEYTNW